MPRRGPRSRSTLRSLSSQAAVAVPSLRSPQTSHQLPRRFSRSSCLALPICHPACCAACDRPAIGLRSLSSSSLLVRRHICCGWLSAQVLLVCATICPRLYAVDAINVRSLGLVGVGTRSAHPQILEVLPSAAIASR